MTLALLLHLLLSEQSLTIANQTNIAIEDFLNLIAFKLVRSIAC